MSRTITHHLANPTDTGVVVRVLDEPDPKGGGACHAYEIEAGATTTRIKFQQGAVREVGRNGVTNEALLAVRIDRYEHLQAGPFPSPEGAETLDLLRRALDAQHRRTRAREARSVEGKSST
jgi:hypothetical protein